MRTALFIAASLCASCAPARDLVADLYSIPCRLNPSPQERAHLDGAETFCVAGSYSYLIPVDDRGGVALIDGGFVEDGVAIERALRGRTVRALLLTHGHPDHKAGAFTVPAPVYVGAGDVPLVEGRYVYRRVAPALHRVLGLTPVPADLRPVVDGQIVAAGTETFTAIAMPGHTPGSTGWLWRDTLFSGDALQSPLGDEVYPAPYTVTEDMRRAYRSLRRLRDVPFARIADAHFGVRDDAKRALRRAVDRDRDEEGALWDYPLLRPTGCSE